MGVKVLVVCGSERRNGNTKKVEKKVKNWNRIFL